MPEESVDKTAANEQNPVGTGSLLDATEAAEPPPSKPTVRERLNAADAALRAKASAAWSRRPFRYGLIGVAAAGLVGGGLAVYETYRFEPPPDYTAAPIDEVFEYTLLTEDFNRLPVERRLELIKELVQRLRSLGTGDSVLMAYLASMIAGEAREQMEENVSRIAVDLFDSYAKGYDPAASAEQREAYLLSKFVEFERMMEGIAGIDRDATPEERIADAQREARARLAEVRSGALSADEALRAFDVLNNGIGRYASGQQRIRISGMMRDLVWTLRRGGTKHEPVPAANTD